MNRAISYGEDGSRRYFACGTSMGFELSAENDKKSVLESRNVTVGNKRTSMRLEQQMWTSLEKIARTEGVTINNLCTQIDLRRRDVGLTSATRVFIICYFRHLVHQHETDRAAPGAGLTPSGLTPRVDGLKGASLARWVLDTVVPAAVRAGGRHRGRGVGLLDS